MNQTISIRIDGEYIKATEGQTIIQAAHANGKTIPSLCYMTGVSPVGGCRLCMVEVKGVNRLLPACTTAVDEGMSVSINTPRLQQYRRMVLELLFCERNHVCAVCVSNNRCELQNLARQLGVTNVRYTYNYPRLPVDTSHPRFVLDHNRCVLCTRCVRVCHEMEGAHVWEVGARGVQSMIVCELNQPWGDSSDCTSCGKCIQACPTGALAEKGMAVEEMVKRQDRIERLAHHREVHA